MSVNSSLRRNSFRPHAQRILFSLLFVCVFERITVGEVKFIAIETYLSLIKKKRIGNHSPANFRSFYFNKTVHEVADRFRSILIYANHAYREKCNEMHN